MRLAEFSIPRSQLEPELGALVSPSKRHTALDQLLGRKPAGARPAAIAH